MPDPKYTQMLSQTPFRIVAIKYGPYLLSIGLLIGSILPYFGRYYYLLDHFSFLRVYLLYTSTILVFLTLVLRKLLAVMICLAALTINIVEVFPFLYFPRTPSIKPLTLSHFNVNRFNTNTSLVETYLREKNPDIACFMEVTEMWGTLLESLNYPFAITQYQENFFGMAVYSRIPFTEQKILHFFDTTNPAIEFSIVQSGEEFRCIYIHNFGPHTAKTTAQRDAYLANLLTYLEQDRTAQKNLIVFGDFNMAPWSVHYKRFCRTLHLTNAGYGFGLHHTFYRMLYFLPAMLSIDHVLYQGNLSVSQFLVGPRLGSDHHLIWVEIGQKTQANSFILPKNANDIGMIK